MMRSILLVLCLFAAPFVYAQVKPDQRTTTTKIADLLARLPSKDAQQHSASMQLMETLGEKGLEELSMMLKDPQTQDNTTIEYALAGFSYYVKDGKHELARRMAARAYNRALPKTKVVANKIFLINQIEIVGDDEIAGYLVDYLGDPLLADAAIRALVQMNTPFTRKALLNSFHGSNGILRIRLIEALGDVRSATAVPFLTGLLQQGDRQLKKPLLYSLSRIADPELLPLLQKEATMAAYGFDTIGATASYLAYLKHLYDNGFTATVDSAAFALWKEKGNQKNKKARFAALNLLTKTRGIDAFPLVIEVVNSESRADRLFALNLALGLMNNNTVATWTGMLKSAAPEMKADILEMLGRSGNIFALPALTESIFDKNTEVSLAAIRAAALLGGPAAQQALTERIKDADPITIASIKSCLLELKGSGVNTSELAKSLPSLSNKAAVAVIEILAAKGATEKLDDVLVYIPGADVELRNAAFAALPNMATQRTLPRLYNLLEETTNDAHLKNIQSAITAATVTIADTAQRIQLLLSAQEKAGASKQHLFYDVFAQVGGRQALWTVSNAFKNGNVTTRMAIVNALANWKDVSAAEPLYRAVEEYRGHADFEKVMNQYITFIRRSKFTAAQRFLELRRAIELSKDPKQQTTILTEMGRCNVLPALLFVGKYLDNSVQRKTAANAIMQIALSDDHDWNGKMVRQIIEKAIPLVNGADAVYQKNALRKFIDGMKPGDGYLSMFNGKNLEGWQGLVENPVKRAQMSTAELARAQAKEDSIMHQGWEARDGLLIFKGKGKNLCTVKKYGDFEMYVDWKITAEGDAGIYLRGSPQVQVWDTSRVKVGAQVGSGGLYNNKIHPATPLVLADNAIGAWNNFYIKMVGERVTVILNGKKVVDNVVLENYWDRNMPIFPLEQLELQAHGTYVAYRDLYIKELPRPEQFTLSDEEKKEGYKVLFDGTNLDAWQGNLEEYKVEHGELVVRPSVNSKHGNLYTKEEFKDFIYRLEFKLTPGANNGIGLRTPLTGDAAYEGLEVQMLDDNASIYSALKPFQYHGSVYGLIPAKKGFLKSAGEWNYEEIQLIGNKIKVTLNGNIIVDADLSEATRNGTLDNLPHPGAKRSGGHIAFLGHGDVVYIKNIRVRKIQ